VSLEGRALKKRKEEVEEIEAFGGGL